MCIHSCTCIQIRFEHLWIINFLTSHLFYAVIVDWSSVAQPKYFLNFLVAETEIMMMVVQQINGWMWAHAQYCNNEWALQISARPSRIKNGVRECECVHKMCEDISISERFSVDNLDARYFSCVFFSFILQCIFQITLRLFHCLDVHCSALLVHGHVAQIIIVHHKKSSGRCTNALHDCSSRILFLVIMLIVDCWCWIAIKQSYGIFL